MLKNKLADLKILCDDLRVKIAIFETIDESNEFIKKVAFEGIEKDIEKMRGLIRDED